MPRTIRRLALLSLVGLAAAPGPEAARSAETPGLLATQVTITVEHKGVGRRFRATVMAIEGDTLTLLTAAHCMSGGDEGGPALLQSGAEVIEGTVLHVVRNPSYRDATEPPAGQGPKPGEAAAQAPNPRRRAAAPAREVPGPDNAVAKVRFRPSSEAARAVFGAIRAAPGLSARTYPGPDGQTVAIRLIDGHGVEHAIRAGNYGNPRWLEWGAGYKPIPGDSGGGVFVLHTGADGRPTPILIGIIVGNDERGGGASLVAREYPWIAQELPRPAPPGR